MMRGMPPRLLALAFPALLVACGGAPAPAPTTPPATATPATTPAASPAYDPKLAAPTGFATCDLVTVHGGVVVAYAIEGGALRETGRTKLATNDDDELMLDPHIGQGDFANRDHLFLTIGERDVAQVTAGGVAHVTVPPPSAFDRPKPTDGENTDPGALSAPRTGLVISEGAAWWSQCPWGLAADGFQCSSYVHARLWPTTALELDKPALPAHHFAWPTAPAGYLAKPIKGTYRSIACQPPKGATVTLGANPDDTDEEIDGTHWISTEPPLLLVIYGHAGLADLIPDRWTLHAGCTEAPIASGTTAEPGPNGLWLGRVGEDDAAHQFVYRGTTKLGEVPAGVTVLFRPAK